MSWKRFLVSGQLDSVYKAVDWLDSLIKTLYKGQENRGVITDILSWQIVEEGHGFKAVALVLVEARE